MKVVNSTRVVFLSVGLLSCSSATVGAFNSSPSNRNVAPTKLQAASLAISFEEDLALTRQIIMDHQQRSSTVSTEQFIQQMEELVATPEEEETPPSVTEVDVSVPYDAAARLAYASLEDQGKISYEAFQTQYLANAVALVKSKQIPVDDKVDISVPYDAAARLAYASLEDKGRISYEAFQIQYQADAVALVKSKQPKKLGGDEPPLAAASTDNTAEVTTSEMQSEVADVTTSTAEKKKAHFLQPVVSWVWKKISPK